MSGRHGSRFYGSIPAPRSHELLRRPAKPLLTSLVVISSALCLRSDKFTLSEINFSPPPKVFLSRVRGGSEVQSRRTTLTSILPPKGGRGSYERSPRAGCFQKRFSACSPLKDSIFGLMDEKQSTNRRFQSSDLESFVARALTAVGLSGADAEQVARLMILADLRGSDGHGIFRLP